MLIQKSLKSYTHQRVCRCAHLSECPSQPVLDSSAPLFSEVTSEVFTLILLAGTCMHLLVTQHCGSTCFMSLMQFSVFGTSRLYSSLNHKPLHGMESDRSASSWSESRLLPAEWRTAQRTTVCGIRPNYNGCGAIFLLMIVLSKMIGIAFTFESHVLILYN